MFTFLKNFVLFIALSANMLLSGCAQQSLLVTQKGGCNLEILSTEPQPPTKIAAGQKVYINFKYDMGDYDAVQIWARPRTNGTRTPAYRAHGSPVYHKYDGTEDTIQGWFYFDEPTEVDEVIVRMRDINSDEYICVAKRKVDLKWLGYSKQAVNDVGGRHSKSAVKQAKNCNLEILSTEPQSPAKIRTGQKVYVNFKYDMCDYDAVQIWARPLTEGVRTSGYKAHGSLVYRKSDRASDTARGWFYFDEPTRVDEVIVQMRDKDNGEYVCVDRKKVKFRWTENWHQRPAKADGLRDKSSCD